MIHVRERQYDYDYLIDLFSGAGGFTKGLQDADIKFKQVFYSDIDKYANAVYKYNFPNHKELGDVKSIRTEHIPKGRGIVTFGFPCQDLSIAGKRKGLAGHRSGLFYEAIRLIRILKPEVFIFENVKGIFSADNGQAFISVLREIADIGFYDCEWQLVNTRWVLPQNRERIYFIGHLRGRSQPKVFPVRETNKIANIRNPEIASKLQHPGHSGGNYKGMNLICDSGLHRKWEKREILPPLRSNTGVGHGNLIQTATIGKDSEADVKVVGTLDSGGWEKRHEQIRRVHDVSGISPTIPTGTGGGVMTKIQVKSNTKKGFETAKEGDSINLSQPKSKTRRGRVGVGVGVAQTLETSCNQGVIQSNIRRLTPTECERLQGFPQNWTAKGNFDAEIKEISDTQRYKLMGNAVTVNIVQMIGEKLR